MGALIIFLKILKEQFLIGPSVSVFGTLDMPPVEAPL